MEEKPPSQAGRRRSPQAPFSAPEPGSEGSEQPSSGRRRVAKVPPAVTFRPPEPETGGESRPEKRATPEPETGGESRPEKRATPGQRAGAVRPAKKAVPEKVAKAAPGQRVEPERPGNAAASEAEAPARQVAPAEKVVPAETGAPVKKAAAVKKAAPVKKVAKAAPAKAAVKKAAPRRAAKAPGQRAAVESPVLEVANLTPPGGAEVRPAAAETESVQIVAPTAEKEPAAERQPAVEGAAEMVEAPERAAAPDRAGNSAAAGRGASRTEPWAKIVADPGYAPELLALAAVQVVGPRAKEWVAQTAAAYPGADADAVARLAVAQFMRFGSVGSVFAAAAGSYAPLALLGTNALTYAELVLHVGAAYGVDPTDPERAVDLLVLSRVHPTREDAAEALVGARQPAYEDDSRLVDAVWRFGRMAAAQAAVWAVVRGISRVYPGVSTLAAILTSRAGTRDVAARATGFYRGRRQSQDSQESGSSQ